LQLNDKDRGAATFSVDVSGGVSSEFGKVQHLCLLALVHITRHHISDVFFLLGTASCACQSAQIWGSIANEGPNSLRLFIEN